MSRTSNMSLHFVYSPGYSEITSGNGHILFHTNRSRWVVVNDTGLEIADHLAKGIIPDDVASIIASRYALTLERALSDVSYIHDHLKTNHFLDISGDSVVGRVPRLDSLYLHLTRRCNLSCLQCYYRTSDADTRTDLPTARIFTMIDELTAHGGKSITLSGGEPLLHPDIRKILTYCAPKLTVRLLTNGTMIDREWASFLSSMNIFVQISIDGSTREIHDTIRSPGSFDKSLRAIALLQDAGLGHRLNLCTTVMNTNLHDLRNIISLCERLGVPQVRFLPLRNVGAARRHWDAIGAGLTTADYEQFYDITEDLRSSKEVSVDVSCGLSGFMLKVPEEFSDDDIWCPIGRQLVVDTNGDAFPCVLMMREEFMLGSVHHDALLDITRSRKMDELCGALSERRSKIEKCASCTWRNLCQAGCMGQALDHTNTIWETDDFCNYRQHLYQRAFDKILGTDSRRLPE